MMRAVEWVTSGKDTREGGPGTGKTNIAISFTVLSTYYIVNTIYGLCCLKTVVKLITVSKNIQL